MSKFDRVNSLLTVQKFGYSPCDLSPSSHKLISSTCEFCRCVFDVQYRRATGVCKSCNSISSTYTLQNSSDNKHEFWLKITKNRVSNKVINKEKTIKEFGYNPDNLGAFSAKKVIAICEFCYAEYTTCLNTLSKSGGASCQDCIGVASQYKITKSKKKKREFKNDYVRKNKLLILKYVDGIDRKETKNRFGYDPITLPPNTQKKIVSICPYCGDQKLTRMAYFVSQHGKVACKSCIKLKTLDTIKERYGVSSHLHIPSVKGKLSNPITERLVETTLRKFDIKYIRQYQVGPYSFDFFLPEINLLIECQGDYFHDFKNSQYAGTPKDRGKATYVARHTNHKLLWIWEHEIHLGRLHTIISRRAIPRKDRRINLHDIKLNELSKYDVTAFLSQNHYLGDLGSSSHKYGAMLYDELVSVCLFGPPIRQLTCAKINKLLKTKINNSQLRELKRFCILHGIQKKNMGSFLISKFLKLLKTNDPAVAIVTSFCDPTVGHNGSIYAASGWTKISTTSKSYHYLDPTTQKAIHKKTVYGRARNLSMTENEFVNMVGLIKVPELGKDLWVKRLK